MAVITKYVIVRNGVELDLVFTNKKEADAHDKMLDAAEELVEFIKKGAVEHPLEEAVLNDIAVYLAQNAAEVTRILKGVRPIQGGTKDGKSAQTGVENSGTAGPKNPEDKKNKPKGKS